MTRCSVVILAAGVGSRLRPLTDDLPKALVPVAGSPILEYSLHALARGAREGCCDVAVVVGHRGDRIASYVRDRYPFVRVIWNHEYLRTNNMFSLSLAMTAVPPSAGLVFMNGDCVYDADVVRRAVSRPGTFVFCDPRRAYDVEAMKITTADGRVTGIAKHIRAADAYAVSCDLYSMRAADLPALRDVMHEHLSRGDLNSWTEVALDAAMRRGTITFAPRPVGGFWFEVDNHEDLAAASEVVAAAGAREDVRLEVV